MTELWRPSQQRINQSLLTGFQSYAGERFDQSFNNFSTLHDWSIDRPEQFWTSIWNWCDILPVDANINRVMVGDTFMGTRFFPDARLNFAENLLRRQDDGNAIMFLSENGYRERLTWKQLYARVTKLAGTLSVSGISPGDRVAACVPNVPDTVCCSLAAAAIGATWSSCSPDFGEQGILDRFQQIAPRVLVACDGYHYNGKRIDIQEKIGKVVAQIPSVEKIIIIPHLARSEGRQPDQSPIPGAEFIDEYLDTGEESRFRFETFPFSHPLYIMFSSGTTGLPKCIIHGAGGTLVQHLKEHRLHCDIKPDDRVFFYTTCGWMMWNWLVSALASNATLMLYDGSPFYPDDNVLFDYAESEAISFFGTSAKYLQAMEKKNLTPSQTHELGKLRTIASTGSPLLPEGFDYVYDHIKQDVCLSSISGGTDIVSCFVLGNPNGPVRRGEIQAKGLGMAVDVWDDSGKSIIDEKGELVCTKPFPCMPLGFWNDEDNKRYHDAYFQRFPGVWAHGDFAEQKRSGGFVIYGRSDAVLNPGGVRIGTAEIYRQVEAFDEVLESVAVGQDWEGDVRVLLFVVLKPGLELDENLTGRIKTGIRNGASPRHVPARIYQVADIPRTRSGKISELAVRDVIHGRAIKNSEALANPEALTLFSECLRQDG